MFSYGDPDDPRPNDPRFDTEEDATAAAQAYQIQRPHDGGVLAVWEDESGEIMALVFAGYAYF